LSSQEVLSFEIVIDAKLSEETKAALEQLKTIDEETLGGPPSDISGEAVPTDEETVSAG